jgi:hypothetical protein
VTPLATVDPELLSFGSESRPLRPSRVAKFLACPMSVVLVMHEEDSGGGRAAQTGNLLHDAAEHYHKCKGTEEERITAGFAALEVARTQFPEGDAAKARQIFGSYIADKENQRAEVLWAEEPVRLVLPAEPGDPTGAPIVIAGTLDQVRLHADGVKRVWDIKTGEYLTGDESVLEYLVQQAVYTLAARSTLDDTIEPGGLIYTPAYEKARSRVHLPNPLTVSQCEDLLLTLPSFVSMIRRGLPVFKPSTAACRFCDVKKSGYAWPKCRTKYRGLYGR